MRKTITQQRCRAGSIRAVAGLAGLLLLNACGGVDEGPDEQVRRWLSAAQEAAEAKKRGDFLDLVSPAYVDARGHERDDIGDLIRVYFLRQQSIKLLASIEEIRLYGDSAAEVDLTVAMAGKNNSVFGFSADAYKFQLELQSDGDDWLLISARWGELGKELH